MPFARAASQLDRISTPRIANVLEIASGRITVGTPDMAARMDPELPKLARIERAHNAGLDRDEDWWMNVAVFRLVNQAGKVQEYLTAGNTPKKLNGIGIHSEAHLIGQVEVVGARGCFVDQIYSERIPCRQCEEYLKATCSGALVFYSVNQRCGSQTRTDMLKQAYSLRPAPT